jgi:hypothetical protein
MEVHGMSGRGLIEGFENKHHEIANLKDMLAQMGKTKDRVEKLVQQQSIYLNPMLFEAIEKIRSCGMGTCREEDVLILLDADDDIGREA